MSLNKDYLSFTSTSHSKNWQWGRHCYSNPPPAPLWLKEESNWSDYKSNSRRGRNTTWVWFAFMLYVETFCTFLLCFFITNAIKTNISHKSSSNDVNTVNSSDKYLFHASSPWYGCRMWYIWGMCLEDSVVCGGVWCEVPGVSATYQ